MTIGKECAFTLTVRSPLSAFLIAATLALSTVADVASAQEAPRFAADVTLGWVGFADDGIVGEGVVGGAARWYLQPRISIGPEILFISGQNHSHLVATGNLVWDLFSPAITRARKFTPFFVVGGGIFQTREFFTTGTFTTTEGAFTAGGGLRAQIGNRVTAGFDARVGWELHLRLNGTVGLEW